MLGRDDGVCKHDYSRQGRSSVKKRAKVFADNYTRTYYTMVKTFVPF
jgi:hypothetical protein